jgi:hypothetical protein
MRRGRIGVAQRVHLIKKYVSQPEVPMCALWGKSLCGKWCGLCKLTEDKVTCKECKYYEKRRTKKNT